MITTELLTPHLSNSEVVVAQIYAIEQVVFGDKSFSKEMIASDLDEPDVVMVVLKDGDVIIGFVYALPEAEKVACVVDVAIVPKYQNQGLIAGLMLCLETELKRRGYEYMTEHAMVDNGYADKIVKNYASRIIEMSDFFGEYGKQRYLKIRL